MGWRGAVLAVALVAASPGMSAQPAPSPGETAIAQLRQTVLSGPRCQASKKALTYVGPTDQTLIACLKAHPKATSLRITSLGGPVTPAMEAARIVAQRAMAIEVAGFCGSSCGNYIAAAAARLDVLPDSVIMLHGAPLADPMAQRAQAIAVLDQAGIPQDEENGTVLRSAITQLQAQRALHDAFAAEFAVGREWYDLTAWYRAVRDQPDAPMLLVSPEFAHACLSHPAIGTFWYPASDDERTHMRQLLGGEALFMGADLPTPAACN